MEYLYFGLVLLIGGLLGVLSMYLIFRRSIAIRLTLIVVVCCWVAGLASFTLGRIGLTVVNVVIALAIVMPLEVGLLVWLVREIITPARQMARAAEQIAQLDLPAFSTAATTLAEGGFAEPVRVQTAVVSYQAKNELGDLAAAFNMILARLQEMAAAFARTTARLNEVTQAAENISQGDLTVSIKPQGSVDVLGTAFARMVANLNEMAAATREGSHGITAAASEILASVSQHTAGANEQSAAVNQVTATVDEVRAAAEQTAGKASDVVHLALASVRVSQEGTHSVEALLKGMQEIRTKVQTIAQGILALSDQTQQIGEIIAAVSDIADQSNLLALNAAIEAAKAGEHGKGFAVVAAEVRSLANQSKQATVKVRKLLSDIQRATNAAVLATEQGTHTVETGAELSQRTGAVITELAGTIDEAVQAAQQIAASAHQQSVAMDQIAQAMRDVNQATIQFVAGARQSQAAAEGLNSLARQFQQITERYRVRGPVAAG